MQKIKILIVEDQLIIAESLMMMLENLGYDVPAIFTSGIETLQHFKPGFADIAIMDIQLSGDMNGIDTAMQINKIDNIPIIFITDNKNEQLRKRAINDTNAVYYIQKPFNRSDLFTAVDLALKSIKNNKAPLKKDEPTHLLNDCIFVKNGYGFKKLMIRDILYLKAEGSYTELIFKDSKITFSENLSFFEDKLAFAKEMVRVHRSYIVNINSIYRVHENRMWIADTEIPIGKTYKNILGSMVRFI